MAPETGPGCGVGTEPWWQPRSVLLRFVSDLAADELARQRRISELPALPWPEDLDFGRDLGVDSLERMLLASALAEALHLHESGIEDYLLARRSLGEWVDVAQAGLVRFSDRMTFRTSGSGGQPKPCVHPLASLLQETAQLAGLVKGSRRLLCAVPSHHIYGFLFTVLLPRALGVPPEAVIDARASTPGWLARGARPGDLVVGHPDFWRAVARTVPQWPPGVIGVTSTAPCPDDVSEAVEAAGIERLFHIYGSSETAGIGWRSTHADAYRLFGHWRFSPDQPDQLSRRLPDGQEQVFACQDRLEPLGDGFFNVGPRRDEAVQVGGTNVFPSWVSAVLRRHPLVEDAAVRLMRPEEGARLKAFVVPKAQAGDPALLQAQLRNWIDASLAPAERPKAIRFGPRLPASPTGKLCDWSLDTPATDPDPLFT